MIGFEETYSLIIDATTFRYLISLAISESLDIHLINVVTMYLYGIIDIDIYMKVSKGIKLPKAKSHNMYLVKLKRSMYGLKQSGRMQYNRLTEYLVRE